MKNLLFAGALALALFSAPVVAQECETLDGVKTMLDGYGIQYTVVPADELAAFLASVGAKPEGVTNAIVALMGDRPVWGIEIDGCLTEPAPFPANV